MKLTTQIDVPQILRALADELESKKKEQEEPWNPPSKPFIFSSHFPKLPEIKTPWFPATVSPARSGVYEVAGGGYAYYSVPGGVWYEERKTVKHAYFNCGRGLYAYAQPWRGLTSEPK